MLRRDVLDVMRVSKLSFLEELRNRPEAETLNAPLKFAIKPGRVTGTQR